VVAFPPTGFPSFPHLRACPLPMRVAGSPQLTRHTAANRLTGSLSVTTKSFFAGSGLAICFCFYKEFPNQNFSANFSDSGWRAMTPTST
jgi:hypothetical protein